MRAKNFFIAYIIIIICYSAYSQNEPTQIAPFFMPKVVVAKTKYYVLTQGNSPSFRKIFKVKENILEDTSIVAYEFIATGGLFKKISTANFVRSMFGSAYLNGKIYVAGGFDNKGNYTNTFYEFDIGAKTWIKKTNMSKKRAYLALEAYNNKIYAIFGDQNNSIEVYDPLTAKWEILSVSYGNSKPLTNITSSTIIDNKIYLFGNDGEFIIFNISNLNIEKGIECPFKLRYFSVASSNRKIYLSAGCNTDNIDNTVYMLNTVTNEWVKAGKISVDRCGSGLVFFGSMLIYLGGSSTNMYYETTPVGEIFIYRPIF